MAMMPVLDVFLGLASASSIVVALVVYLISVAETPLRHPGVPPRAKSAVPVLGSISFLLSTWQFSRSERDQLRLSKARKALDAVAFRVGPHPTVALFGPVARKWFFTDQTLKFALSYEKFGVAFFDLHGGHDHPVAPGEFVALRLKRFMTAESIAPRQSNLQPIR